MRNKEPGTGNKTGRRFASLRTMAPALLALVLAAIAFAMPANTRNADAHPLGNFSINRLSIMEIRGTGEVSVQYLVDMAEIPTFQAREAIDPDGDGALSVEEQEAYLAATGAKLLSNVALDVGGDAVALSVVGSSVELLPGQGGLNTARVALELSGVLPEGWKDSASASYADRNFEGTNGWRQVVVRPGSGIDLLQTSAPQEDVTNGLTEYPQDLLKSAPAVTSASFKLQRGEPLPPAPSPRAESGGEANDLSGAGGTVARDEANKSLGRFASLVATENLTPGVIALALVLSVGWGAMHALGPGHGKTVVAAYLVGERGTGRHALYLGLIVTATHTISVFALGAIAVFAADVVNADDIYFWLSLGSGLLVAVLGGGLLLSRLGRLLGLQLTRNGQPRTHDHAHGGETVVHAQHELVAQGAGAALHVVMPSGARHLHVHGSHDHPHGDYGHEHAHQEAGHGHSHVPAQPGWRGIVALGIAGGIVPCPTALVVMLGAIALDRAVFGLVMVTAFSVGLAGVLMGIGLLMVYGKRWLSGRHVPFVTAGMMRRMQLVAPVMSAVTIFGVGVVLTGQALL